jgi:hypothetical protein
MTSQQNFRVDSFVSGLFGKAPVAVATTANITLIGEQTVNTVALLEGDRCLVKDQTDPIENGVYTVEQSAWQRSGDFDGSRDVVLGTMITVWEPGSSAFELYQVTAIGTIDTDAITIEQYIISNVAVVPDPTLQEVTTQGAVTALALEMLNVIMTEAAIPSSPGAGKGRIWVKTGNPNELWWTNEAGTHVQLGTGGTGGLNNVLEDATPELGGTLGCLDEIVQKPELKDYSITSSSPASTTGAITFDCLLSNAFEHTLDENITAITLKDPPATGRYGEMVIKFTQDAVTLRTITGWPAGVKWPGGTEPTMTQTLSRVDMVHLATWDAGATWYATYTQDLS